MSQRTSKEIGGKTSDEVRSFETAKPNFTFEYTMPPGGNYDGFGETLREALEENLAHARGDTRIVVTAVFEGDWACACKVLNSASRAVCRSCNAAKHDGFA